MAKRFTDTDKWKKPFVKSLQAPYKLLWFYILDDCDHAGIWQVDEEVAIIRVGGEIDFNTAKKLFAEQIFIFDDGKKWFIQDFIDFQYGCLNPENRVHNSVLTILNKYNIKPLTSSLQGAKDKDKEKDKDKDKEKDKEGENNLTIPQGVKIKVTPLILKNVLEWNNLIGLWSGYCKLPLEDTKEQLRLFLNEKMLLEIQYETIDDLKSHITNWFKKNDFSKFAKNGLIKIRYQEMGGVEWRHREVTKERLDEMKVNKFYKMIEVL